MAKRKRLSPAAVAGAAPETKAAFGWAGTRRPPIADVSGEAAVQAAFEAVSDELRAARTAGRMVLSLPLQEIDTGHLIRDRVVLEEGEMAVLKDSLRARGQQAPVDVQELAPGRYGLISGWRRLTALQELAAETGEARFSSVLALVRRPDEVSQAYLAMVEENEIRADLSFYERARIAVQAAAAGVYPDTTTAVQHLFAAARAPKRSKIMAFTHLVTALDDVLRFPAAVPEKVGLALAAALKRDTGFAARLAQAIDAADPQDASAERLVLDAALKAPRKASSVAAAPAAGVAVTAGKGRVTLSGAGVDAAFMRDLRAWLARRTP